MDRSKFYAALRARSSGVFGTSLSQSQVNGTERILDEAQRRGTPLRHLSYKGDPSQIVPLRRQANRFRKGEIYRLILKHEAEGSTSNKETAQRIVQAKGWNPSLVEPLRQCVNSAKVWRKRKAKL